MKQWPKLILLSGSMISLVLAVAGALILSPQQSVSAAPSWQTSPLSPLTPANAASSVTTTVATTTTVVTTATMATTVVTTATMATTVVTTATMATTATTGLITSTVVTASEPLPVPVEMTSPLTVSAESEALIETPARVVGPSGPLGRPMRELWSLPMHMAGGQISLILVAVLFVALFTVISLVLTRSE